MPYVGYRDYNKDNVNQYASEKAGVYILRVSMQDGSWQRIYVGQAANLKKRLLEHLSPAEPNECIREHVQKYKLQYNWIEIASQARRDAEEKSKYDEFKPECNLISPPA